MWYTQTYVYTMKYYLAIQSEICHLQQHGWILKGLHQVK